MELKEKREKEKMALKKKIEVLLSSSTAVIRKKSSNIQIVANDKSAALKDLNHAHKGKEVKY